ncbi:MAG: COG0488: ATPase components of ABC transporters with duplicated ATPase domains [uncultured Sulfurovum sp.]|uniref:COG0488: ATPase components of ABC transporters with duplicated ATPase domains n=2 Tax=uncultured Sulfurovum sp. TaxID=269237 RepID=A0A6S6U8R4_9BACT|nr:MAG: COG0488: ATPase components of ABC transporters with duplicated ATPase domains [uncultured Sulfurovum sp.]
MALVGLFNIAKNYDVKQLLKGVDFQLNEGERVAIVGQNGCGKSTLIKIISGEVTADEGTRVLDKSIIIDALDQMPTFKEGLNVRDAIESELTDLSAAKQRYEALSNLIAEDFENKVLLDEHAQISNYLDHHNAWNLDDKIERVLQEFKLKEYEYRDVNTLSGGEQRRVALASLILKKPDVLLLDEPTNHLDVYMVEFLEEILLKEKFTLLIISHDRHFINSIATRVVEVENMNIVSYEGGYDKYLVLKEERMKSMAKTHDTLLKFLKREEEWLSRGVKARLTRNQGRKARVFELRDKAKKDPTLIRKMQVDLEREKKSFNRGDDKGMSKKKMLFDIENLHYSIVGKNLIENFTTRILQRDKIAIVGHNGSGKSTLLKLLLKRIQPNKGTIDQGDFKVGYFDQHREMLDENKTILDTFCPDGGDIVDVMGKNMHVFAYMKSFLFPEEYMLKKLKMLSGGEKNRVALALLFTRKVDCLILDEPTNDLDIQTINILEEKLLNFPGALIFVSHDRYFIDKIANKLLIFKGNGVLEESFQEYSEYLLIEKNINELYEIEKEVKTAKETPVAQIKEEKKKTKLSYKDQRDLERLPALIEELEAKIDEINACLYDAECYEAKGLINVTDELKKVEAEYEEMSERYLEVLELEEELSGN